MSRKNKIRIAVACVVLGAVVWSFFSEDEVRVLSVVPSATSSEMLITVTNSTLTIFSCYLGWEVEFDEGTGQVYYDQRPGSKPARRHLNARSATTFDLGGYYGDRQWRAIVFYDQSTQSRGGVRDKAAAFAEKHNWPRVGKWIRPKSALSIAYGPEMLGNQPAPSGHK
jgi:hypothetical protein